MKNAFDAALLVMRKGYVIGAFRTDTCHLPLAVHVQQV